MAAMFMSNAERKPALKDKAKQKPMPQCALSLGKEKATVQTAYKYPLNRVFP